jgi:hypothetical protein
MGEAYQSGTQCEQSFYIRWISFSPISSLYDSSPYLDTTWHNTSIRLQHTLSRQRSGVFNMRAEETRQDMPRGEEEQMTGEPATDQENPTPDAPMFGRVPDGGTRAWLVAAGACFITFSALGFANSFGVFQEYYISHQLQHKSPDDIAWIGSLSTCLQFTAGAIAGPLFDRVGPWVRLSTRLPLRSPLT